MYHSLGQAYSICTHQTVELLLCKWYDIKVGSEDTLEVLPVIMDLLPNGQQQGIDQNRCEHKGLSCPLWDDLIRCYLLLSLIAQFKPTFKVSLKPVLHRSHFLRKQRLFCIQNLFQQFNEGSNSFNWI